MTTLVRPPCIGALSLILRGLVHIYSAPHAHACSGGISGERDAFGDTLGILSHVLAYFSEGDGGMDNFRTEQPNGSDAEAGDAPAQGREGSHGKMLFMRVSSN